MSTAFTGNDSHIDTSRKVKIDFSTLLTEMSVQDVMAMQKDQLTYILLIIAISLLLLAVIFILFLVQNAKIRNQKQIESLNSVFEMQENERKRISMDLHDEIGPMLSAIKLRIYSIRQLRNQSEIENMVSEVAVHLDTLIQDVRQIIRNLSPTNLRKAGLIHTIETFKNAIECNNNIRFEFMHEGLEVPMNEKAELNIYRIVSEFINNSLRHSQCSLIKLIIKRYAEKTLILYSDNGNKKEKSIAINMGMGLQNIESRVNYFQGSIYRKPDFAEGAFYQISFDNRTLFSQLKTV